MTIHITKTPDIYLTPGELSRYRYEYDQAFRMYCGPRPTFEEFVASREAMKKRDRDSQPSGVRK